MEFVELNLNQFLEVKLLRLNKPKFNQQVTPLTGSYNSIEELTKVNSVNNEHYEKLFEEYALNDYSNVPIDNMFTLSSTFGKVLFCETLEALLIINNTSDKEVRIKDLKIRVSNESQEGYESMFKKTDYTLVNTQNAIVIPGNQFYNQKIKINADIMCKYSIEIDLQYNNQYFNDEYMKQSVSKIVKTISTQYFVENNTTTVTRKYYKKFLFATNLPFKIKEKFVNNNMESCLIEVNLINQSPYCLIIDDILLLPDGQNSNDDFISILNEKEMKKFSIESEEEVSIVFKMNSYNSTINYNSYLLKVSWKNSFDSVNKYINYVLKNRLNTFNELFSIYPVEKPISNTINMLFKVVLKIVNKTNKNLKLKISKENLFDKEIDVIDIIEKEIELIETSNLTLMCKSEFKGNLNLPRITIYEELSKKTICLDKILNIKFNENASLI